MRNAFVISKQPTLSLWLQILDGTPGLSLTMTELPEHDATDGGASGGVEGEDGGGSEGPCVRKVQQCGYVAAGTLMHDSAKTGEERS